MNAIAPQLDRRDQPAPHPWDAAAEGWNEHSRIIRDWLREPTAMMLDAARVQPGARVLDIAAGAGEQTLDIARRVGEQGFVLATDISPRILELAQQKFDDAVLSQVHTRVVDAEALELDGAQFDAAVCRLGLMFCTDVSAALRGVHNALRRRGRFSALVFSGPQGNPCLTTMMRIACRHARVTPASPFLPGSLMSLGEQGKLAEALTGTGFAEVEVRTLSQPFRLASSRHYIDFVRSAGSPIMQLLAALPDAGQREAWDEMALALAVYDTESGWVGPHELLLCSATSMLPTASD